MWYLTRILTQLSIIGVHVVTIGTIIWSYARTHRIKFTIAMLIVISAVGALLYFTATDPNAEVKQLSEVALIRVGDLAGAAPLSVIGDIRSTNEALVSPESSGAVQAIYLSLGDYVSAGQIIAELKNDGQRAAVSQARAILEKTKSGVSVGGIGLDTAKGSLSSAQEAAQISIDGAYASIDNAVRKSVDSVFSNPESAQPNFFVTTSNSQQAINAESYRVKVQPILKRHLVAENPVSIDDLLSELTTVSQEATIVRDLLSNVVLALNNAIATNGVTETQIAGYRLDTNSTLSSINGLRTSLSSTIELLKAKRSAVAISVENLSQNDSGQNADITSAQANVQAALANLERTVIRAPISGTINKLDIDIGSFVNASVPVVYITNARGVEAVVYVSEKDIRDVIVGARASVSGLVEGKVIRVAQALDPMTKKAEIRIALPANAPLVSGQSASIEIERAKKLISVDTTFSIPISALKITPEGAVVFTVVDGLLVSQAVALGSLEGAKIQIISGITADMNIVSDARGLKDGQSVTIKAN